MLIISLVVLQVVVFAGLVFILKRVITQNVISATQHLEKLDREYSKKEDGVDRRLQEVQKKSQDILENARGEAEKLKAQIIKEAETEKDNMLKDARFQSDEIIEQADKLKELLISEINERIYRQAMEKACELIQDALPDKFKEDIHKEWVEELLRNGFGQLENLDISEDIKEVKVVSGFSIKEKEREMISEKIKSALGRDISIVEETDPKLVAGIVVSIGGLVLDGSLRNKIREKTKGA